MVNKDFYKIHHEKRGMEKEKLDFEARLCGEVSKMIEEAEIERDRATNDMLNIESGWYLNN